VAGSGISRSVTVTQAAGTLTIAPANVNVGPTNGTITLTVTSNIAWTASDNVSWLSLSTTRGSNNSNITASFSTNSGAARTAVITVTGGGITSTMTVTQAAPTLTVSPTTLSVGSTSGTATVTVTSNTTWTASDNATWLTVSPSSGSNDGTLTLTFAANTGTTRNATLTVRTSSLTRTVAVTQRTTGQSPTADGNIEEEQVKPVAVFPNPTTGLVYVVLPNRQMADLSIHNLLGQIIVQKNQVNEDTSFDISSQPDGIYWLQIEKDGHREVKKIVKTGRK
jgi:Viral BACON domain/Secretion system C-terminal sorting domain